MKYTSVIVLLLVSILSLNSSLLAQQPDKSPLLPGPAQPTAATQPAPQPSPTPDPATVPQTRRVSVLVTAADHSGNPVRDLTKDQISITDNGQPGTIVGVQPASDLPLDLAIVLLSSKNSFAQQQAAAVELVHHALRPNIDQAFILTAGGDKLWPNGRLAWQTAAAALETTIRSLDPNTGVPDVSFDLKTDSVVNSRFNLQQYRVGGFTVFSIIATMMKADPRPARHVVAIFRSAWAHSPGASSVYEKYVEAQHTNIITQAQQTRTSFYIIGVDDPKTLPTGLSQSYSTIHAGEGGEARVADQYLEKFRDRLYSGGRANLERMAEQTGGQVWWSSKKNYPDAVASIVNALNAQFVVRYEVPAGPTVTAAHSLQVKANSANARIFAPSAYFSRQAPAPAPATNPPTATSRVAD